LQSAGRRHQAGTAAVTDGEWSPGATSLAKRADRRFRATDNCAASPGRLRTDRPARGLWASRVGVIADFLRHALGAAPSSTKPPQEDGEAGPDHHRSASIPVRAAGARGWPSSVMPWQMRGRPEAPAYGGPSGLPCAFGQPPTMWEPSHAPAWWKVSTPSSTPVSTEAVSRSQRAQRPARTSRARYPALLRRSPAIRRGSRQM
jgi:hypothetical protein